MNINSVSSTKPAGVSRQQDRAGSSASLVHHLYGVENQALAGNDNEPAKTSSLTETQKKTFQAAMASYISCDCPDLYQIAQQLAGLPAEDKEFCERVKQHPEYQFLKSMLPALVRIAEGFVPANFSDLEQVELFLGLLAMFSPSPLGLLNSATRTQLVELAANITADEEAPGIPQNKINKFILVSALLKAAAYLKPDEVQQLLKIRENLRSDELLKELSNTLRLLPPRLGSHQSMYLSLELIDAVKRLVPAFLVRPMGSQLEALFGIAESFPYRKEKTILLGFLCPAIEFLNENRRDKLFDLAMEIAATEARKNQELDSYAIDLFTNIVEKARYWRPEQVKKLIAFIMDYKEKAGRAKLLCSLTNAVERLDQPLRAELIEIMKERGETDTLNGRLLKIDQLEKEQVCRLVSEILHIDNEEERVDMLRLLGERMKYLDLADRKKILSAVLSIEELLPRATVLCRLAANIDYLEEEDRYRLLKAIDKSNSYPGIKMYKAQEAFSICVDAVTQKLASLRQQQQAASAQASLGEASLQAASLTE